jgi:hypothetical protein
MFESHSQFFGFHPVRWRAAALMASGVCAVLTAFALVAARHHQPLAWLRVVLYLALMSGFSWLWLRLRPRVGWGVSVGPLAITISRPLGGEAQLAWSQVADVRRDSRRKSRLGVFSQDGEVIWIESSMFPNFATFEAMLAAVLARAEPAPDRA